MNKRLNEQFEKSKKNVMNETGAELNKQFTSTLRDQQDTITDLQSQVSRLKVIESAYNSDKHMFYRTLEDLNSQIEDLTNKVNQKEKSCSE